MRVLIGAFQFLLTASKTKDRSPCNSGGRWVITCAPNQHQLSNVKQKQTLKWYSIKSWLVDRVPYNGSVYSLYNMGSISSLIWVFPKIMVRFPPKSSVLIGFSIINHPFWGFSYFWVDTHMQQMTRLLVTQISRQFVATKQTCQVPMLNDGWWWLIREERLCLAISNESGRNVF